jgi:hypothetical protein
MLKILALFGLCSQHGLRFRRILVRTRMNKRSMQPASDIERHMPRALRWEQVPDGLEHVTRGRRILGVALFLDRTDC